MARISGLAALLFRYLPNQFGGFKVRRSVYKRIFERCGRNLEVGEGAIISKPWKISVGDNVLISNFCHLIANGGISIGNNVRIAPMTGIWTVRHDCKAPMDGGRDKVMPVVIGDGYWIGFGSMLMPGITIGKGCVVGAGAVVTRSFPEGTVIAGIPGRAIKRIKSLGGGRGSMNGMKNYKCKLAREYDSLTAMSKAGKSRFKKWLLGFLREFDRDIKILDMGCFDGNVLKLLKEKGFKNLYGVEINRNLRKTASRYGRIYGYNLEEPLPIRDGSFDVILQVDLHEHLYNARELLKETHRILRDDGALVIFTSNHQHISKRVAFLFGYIGRKSFGFGEHHVRFVSHRIFKRWLEPYFKIEHIPRKLPFNNLLKRHCWYVCRKRGA